MSTELNSDTVGGFGHMGPNDPYGNNSANVGAGGTGGSGGNGHTTGSTSSGGNTGVSVATQTNANRRAIYAGTIPAGYVLVNGKIGHYVDHIIHESIGHGETRDRVVGKNFVEVPAYTQLWNEGAADRASGNDAIAFSTGLLSDLSKRLGDKAGQLANQMAHNVEGHALRNFDAALGAFNKYHDGVFNKFGAADINAIKQALAAVDQNQLATRLDRFSKALGVVSHVPDGIALYGEVKNSLNTGNWHGTLVKANAIVAGADISYAAAAVLAVVAAPETAVTLGAMSLMGAIAGAFVTDDTIEKAGKLIDSAFHL